MPSGPNGPGRAFVTMRGAGEQILIFVAMRWSVAGALQEHWGSNEVFEVGRYEVHISCELRTK